MDLVIALYLPVAYVQARFPTQLPSCLRQERLPSAEPPAGIDGRFIPYVADRARCRAPNELKIFRSQWE